MRDKIRDINLDGYRLELFDLSRSDSDGKSILGYTFTGKDGIPLFDGEDFHCAPLDAIDSDETVRSLLGFLTLRPGDTDREYFEDYTPEQMAFAQGDAEGLSVYAMELENEEQDAAVGTFENWKE